MTDDPPARFSGLPTRLTRRRLLQLGVALPLPLVLAACDDGAGGGRAAGTTAAPTTSPATTAAGALPPTPACDDGDDPTPEQTEGPYFTPDSPERASLLEAGMAGDRLTLAGTVLATDCRPVRRALLDFWQADAGGQYDNQGYRLRGHQFTDAEGRFRLETIVPGLYPGRTRHIHVKVQAPDRPVLTTQLYFPGEAANDSDGIFRQELLLDVAGGRASFTFVLEV
ncbi:MAG TPA: intradiol ring-cleavage dioxygenase [Actinomycetes bacterium]|jgi:protocatechuate 3,4-dioxygenase beta subunit|nr:intradiol ring-cleavage dioxygenase [Actinomycetes bacterium]